jgi:hypothetical protein
MRSEQQPLAAESLQQRGIVDVHRSAKHSIRRREFLVCDPPASRECRRAILPTQLIFRNQLTVSN